MKISTFSFKAAWLLAILFLPYISFAQMNGNYILSGIVKDDTGQPLPSVSVKIKGSTAGSTSNLQGKPKTFSL